MCPQKRNNARNVKSYMGDNIMTIVSVISALGGFKFIEFLMNRKSNNRIVEATANVQETKADKDEFYLLREQIEFLQKQINEKETRFSEQTNIVRQQNLDIINLMKEKAALELELQQKRCEVPNCLQRKPQNGF